MRTALKAAWHVVVHLLVVVIDVTQVLAVAWFATVVVVVHGNAANAAVGATHLGQLMRSDPRHGFFEPSLLILETKHGGAACCVTIRCPSCVATDL